MRSIGTLLIVGLCGFGCGAKEEAKAERPSAGGAAAGGGAASATARAQGSAASTAGAAPASAAAAAGGPSPEGMCKKLTPWAAEKAGKAASAEVEAECVKDMKELQRRNPAQYGCFQRCAGESSSATYDACVGKNGCKFDVGPAAGAATAAGSTTAAGAGSAAERYDMGGIKPLPASCKDPGVFLATTKFGAEDKRVEYGKDPNTTYVPWHFVRQTVIAYTEFKSVTSKPGKPMEVQFIEGVYDNDKMAPALVARCADVETCNKLMGAYKRVVPTARPEPLCGLKSPHVTVGDGNPGFLINGKMAQDKADTPISRCVRLAACGFASGASVQGDPALECQKAPAKFKLDCAAKPTCDEVNRCAR